MNKIKRVIKPEDEKSRWALYKIVYETNDRSEYEAHVFKEEYKVRMLKQQMVFDMGFSEEKLEEFEDAVIAMTLRED